MAVRVKIQNGDLGLDPLRGLGLRINYYLINYESAEVPYIYSIIV